MGAIRAVEEPKVERAQRIALAHSAIRTGVRVIVDDEVGRVVAKWNDRFVVEFENSVRRRIKLEEVDGLLPPDLNPVDPISLDGRPGVVERHSFGTLVIAFDDGAVGMVNSVQFADRIRRLPRDS